MDTKILTPLIQSAARFSGLPIRLDLPKVEPLRINPIEALFYDLQGRTVSASYSQVTNVMSIPNGFDFNTAKDRSTAIHELVHFLQFGPEGPWGNMIDEPPADMTINYAKGQVEGPAYLAQCKWGWQYGMTPLYSHGLSPDGDGFVTFEPEMTFVKELNEGPWLDQWRKDWAEVEDLSYSERIPLAEAHYALLTERVLNAEGHI